MKDLKHLEYFEDLLADTENDLVRKAKAEGRIIIGHNCYQIPEVLLNLPGCTAVRMRAPGTGSMEIGTYYMTSLNCEYCRAIVERCAEGGFNFLDCIFDAYACSQLADANDNIEHLHLCDAKNDKFFVAHVDTPIKSDENAVRHLTRMCRARVLNRLNAEFGIDVSDEALREAVREHNEKCRLITELGEYRRRKEPVLTGYEFAVFCLATYCAPFDMIRGRLEETVQEVAQREPDRKTPHRIRVVVAGSEIDDPAFIRLIEDAGALVVADRYCFGSMPGRKQISLNDEEDVLKQICRHNINECQCPRYMDNTRIRQRKEYLDRIAWEYSADGIIVQQMNFCNFWPYERAAMAHIMPEEFGWPVLSIDRPYIVGTSGQMRTRIQAFIESVEIKKIRRGGDSDAQ